MFIPVYPPASWKGKKRKVGEESGKVGKWTKRGGVVSFYTIALNPISENAIVEELRGHVE